MKKAIATIAALALSLALVAPARYAAAAVEEYTRCHYSEGYYRDCPPEK